MFFYHKNPTLIDDTDNDNILISDKASCNKGYKQFNGYEDDKKGKSIRISGLVKSFNKM